VWAPIYDSESDQRWSHQVVASAAASDDGADHLGRFGHLVALNQSRQDLLCRQWWTVNLEAIISTTCSAMSGEAETVSAANALGDTALMYAGTFAIGKSFALLATMAHAGGKDAPARSASVDPASFTVYRVKHYRPAELLADHHDLTQFHCRSTEQPNSYAATPGNQRRLASRASSSHRDTPRRTSRRL
jgi:hypothetical protein